MQIQGSGAGNPAEISNQMFEIIKKAQQTQQQLANEMIELAVAQKTQQGKNLLLGKIIDVRI